VFLIDELSAGLDVHAVGVAQGVHTSAEPVAGLHHVHLHPVPLQLAGGTETGEAAAGDDDTGAGRSGHTYCRNGRPAVCVGDG
jgi:hypothetical protein